MKQQGEMAKKKALLYANGSFDNKGCEAITRGACKILQKSSVSVSVGTNAISIDEEIANELGAEAISIPRSRESLFGIISEVCRRTKMKKLSVLIPFFQLKRLGKRCAYSFSIGGDNYCYEGPERFYRMNRSIRNKNSKNYFWGCSLEESYFDSMMRKDLMGYDAIFARENRTYTMLINKGFTNVIKCTDPAFVMEKQVCDFCGANEKKFIGFNISPLTLSCSPNPDETLDSVVKVLQDILNQTEYSILLIPHVYGAQSDYMIHQRISDRLHSDRVIVIEEKYNSPQLKHIISCCEVFVGSRTHATIAAYSTFVPTLVLGYSVKSVGIAEDLFGTAEGYVLKVQNGITYSSFSAHVMRLIEDKEIIKAHLHSVMGDYIQNAYAVLEVLKNGEIVG